MGKFRTKARAVELLGRKQIRDSVTALAELMKNSYDADAPWLRVEFDTNKESEHIIIADSGNGMNRIDIEEKWLVLGTNSKTNSKDRQSPGGRTLMGAKGIGRLASARLGKQLWMITKSNDELWNIVYINWNLFENQYLSLEDIQIPVLYGISTNEILERFNMIKKELVTVQKENLKLEGWFRNEIEKPGELNEDDVKLVREELQQLYEETVSGIRNCSISLKYIKKYLNISNGTILYIDGLNDDNWEKCFSAVSADKKSEDMITQKYFNRLASFVSGFRHAGTDTDKFDVKIYVNNELWDEDYAYIDEDYRIYDIKIEGKVEKGKFYGSIDARNADRELIERANQILEKGRDVTEGIANWKEVDCGLYSLKFCHIEGIKDNSGLPDDDYARIRRKLDVTGGVCVYRDGVRVLPYGEPENDFLNMEERRSYNAGNYIFSHRNLFGRIDIDSYHNPKLEDKSSREGLIENRQYFYFIKTMENLLVDLAFNFFSNARKDSMEIREKFVKRNKQEKEDKKRKEQIEKEEKRRSVVYIKELKELLKTNHQEVVELGKKAMTLVRNWEKDVSKVMVESGYNQIISAIDKVNLENDTMRTLVETKGKDMEIVIDKRFLSYCGEKLCKEVVEYNFFKDSTVRHISQELENGFLQCSNNLKQKFEEWEKVVSDAVKSKPEAYGQLLMDRLKSVTDNCNYLLKGLDNKISENQSLLNEKVESAKEYFAEIDNYTSQIKKNRKYCEISTEMEKLSLFKNEIKNVFDSNPQNVALEGDNILDKLEEIYQEIYKSLQVLKNDSEGIFQKCLTVAEKLNITADAEYTDEYLIGELRVQNIRLENENEIYSDLANLGMASEIVSHEFNQLYTNVRNAIKNLAPYIRNANARYWLRQIETGFRAVSDRQNQLSPMYRSYSLRKRNVNLKEFLDEICDFMANILEKEHINIDNRISEDVELYISPSKMFPAISNIVNNSSYWVLSKDEKIIRFRYEDSDKALYIEDSGTGITAFDKESIFQPFVSFKPNGRGLGLAIVKRVLESQGYNISIAKEEEKTLPGACFKITFTDE